MEEKKKCCLVNSDEWIRVSDEASEYRRIKDDYYKLQLENCNLKNELKEKNLTLTIGIETVTSIPNPRYFTEDKWSVVMNDIPKYKHFHSLIDHIQFIGNCGGTLDLPNGTSLARLLKKCEKKVVDNIMTLIHKEYDGAVDAMNNEYASLRKKYDDLKMLVDIHDKKCLFDAQRIIKRKPKKED